MVIVIMTKSGSNQMSCFVRKVRVVFLVQPLEDCSNIQCWNNIVICVSGSSDLMVQPFGISPNKNLAWKYGKNEQVS